MKKIAGFVLAFLAAPYLFAGATFSRVHNWSDLEVLTASDLNAEFNNILNNLTPAGMDDYSTNSTEMRTTADPYPGSVESLATSLQGEIERLRYQILQLKLAIQTSSATYWYQDAPPTGNFVINQSSVVVSVPFYPSSTTVMSSLSISTISTSSNEIDITTNVSVSGTLAATTVNFTGIAGSGLAGGEGSALSVNVDNSTLEINSDTLRVKDEGITSAKLNVTRINLDWTYAGTSFDPGASTTNTTWDPVAVSSSGVGFTFSSNQFTAPVSGLYLVGGYVKFNRDDTTGIDSTYTIKLTGSRTISIHSGGTVALNTNDYYGVLIYMASGETYDIQIIAASMGGGNPNFCKTEGQMIIKLAA